MSVSTHVQHDELNKGLFLYSVSTGHPEGGQAIEDEHYAGIQPSMEGGNVVIIEQQTTIAEGESTHPMEKEEQHSAWTKDEGDTSILLLETEGQPLIIAEDTIPTGGIPTAERSVAVAESRDRTEQPPSDVVGSTNVRKDDTTEETENASPLPKVEGVLPSSSGAEESIQESEIMVLRLSDQENDSQTHIPETNTELGESLSKEIATGEEEEYRGPAPPTNADGEAKEEDLPHSLAFGQESPATTDIDSIPNLTQWAIEAPDNERSANESEHRGLGEELQVAPEGAEQCHEKPYQSNESEYNSGDLAAGEKAIHETEANGDKGAHPIGEAPAICEEVGIVEKLPMNTSTLAPTEVEGGDSITEEDVPEISLGGESYKIPVVQEKVAIMSENLGPSVIDHDNAGRSISPLPPANEQVSIETFNKDDTGAGDQQEVTKAPEGKVRETTAGEGTGTATAKEQSPDGETGGWRRRGTRVAVRRPKARKRLGQESSPPEEGSPPAIEMGEKTTEGSSVTPLDGKESVEESGTHLNPQPTPPAPLPRARSKTPEVPHREDFPAQTTPAKEEAEMETASPQLGSHPHVKQRRLPQLPTKDDPVATKQPDEGEAVGSPPGSPELRRSSRTVSRESRRTYLSSSRRNRHTETSEVVTADKSAPDREIPTDSYGQRDKDEPVTEEGNPQPSAQEPPTDRLVTDTVTEVQLETIKLGDVESASQMVTVQQTAVSDTEKSLGKGEASLEDHSLPVSETERENRRKSPLPGLEEGIDISNFNLSTPPSEPPPELPETIASRMLEEEEHPDRSGAMQPPVKEEVQEAQIMTQEAHVLSMSPTPQMVPSQRRQHEEKREEEAPKAFEKFKAEEGLPRSSRVLSTKEARPKLSVRRRVDTKQTDKPESDRQEAQVEPQLSHIVTEAETGQEMKDTNTGKPDADIEHKKEQPSMLEGPMEESEDKSIRRRSEVIHRKKTPRVSRLSERKVRTAILEDDETQSNEGGAEKGKEDSDSRFRKVRVQWIETQTDTHVSTHTCHVNILCTV